MKTLVVHPDDRTTDFLKPIYNRLSDTTVLTGGNFSSSEMNNLIEEHDRVIMLGHGWEHGLLSKGVFTHCEYIIDSKNVDALKLKDNSVFIWCYAEEFVACNNLKGICTGMFISEPLEALMNDVDYQLNDITTSNDLFAGLLGDSLSRNASIKEAYYDVFRGYTCPTNSNQVLAYNAERWYYYM
jgi:hypothetical protein